MSTSPSSTAIPPPPPPPLSSGLGTGAKAAIAAACAVGVVVLVSLCICLHISYRKRRDPAYRREKEAALSASYHTTYQNSNLHLHGEGGAPLLRDGSYMDLSMQSLGTSAHGSPMVGSDDGLSPGKFKNNHNTPYASSNWLSPTSEGSPAKLEKERWRESHSTAGYFDRKTAEPESPRLSTGDKMVAEWRREEIERARERSMDREREKKEPHPMAAYQNALPPFYPRGFRDISGDANEPVPVGDHSLDPEVHEMDVGVEGVHTRK